MSLIGRSGANPADKHPPLSWPSTLDTRSERLLPMPSTAVSFTVPGTAPRKGTPSCGPAND
jgi:hypothetical protein